MHKHAFELDDCGVEKRSPTPPRGTPLEHLGDSDIRQNDHDNQGAQACANGDSGNVLVRVAVVQTHGGHHAEHRAGVRQRAADSRGGRDNLGQCRGINARSQIRIQEVASDNANSTRAGTNVINLSGWHVRLANA